MLPTLSMALGVERAQWILAVTLQLLAADVAAFIYCDRLGTDFCICEVKVIIGLSLGAVVRSDE